MRDLAAQAQEGIITCPLSREEQGRALPVPALPQSKGLRQGLSSYLLAPGMWQDPWKLCLFVS